MPEFKRELPTEEGVYWVRYITRDGLSGEPFLMQLFDRGDVSPESGLLRWVVFAFGVEWSSDPRLYAWGPKAELPRA